MSKDAAVSYFTQGGDGTVTREEAADVFRRINDVNADLREHIDDVKDSLGNKIDSVSIAVAAMAAQHEVCRPLVMGNGRPSLSDRVTQLETRGATRSWAERLILGGLVSILAIFVGWMPHILHWW